MKSFHNQLGRCCCYPPFSHEKTRNLRGYEICLPLISRFEPKSGGFQIPCSYPSVRLVCAPYLSIVHLLGKAAMVREDGYTSIQWARLSSCLSSICMGVWSLHYSDRVYSSFSRFIHHFLPHSGCFLDCTCFLTAMCMSCPLGSAQMGLSASLQRPPSHT